MYVLVDSTPCQEVVMHLNQPEIIQVLRKRAGLNQGQLGARAFNTSIQTGRTKIKNIELGKQAPTHEDLENMARALDVPPSILIPESSHPVQVQENQTALQVNPSVLSRFPGLDVYLELLSKAATLDDAELIDHIAAKICELLGNRPSLSMAAPR